MIINTLTTWEEFIDKVTAYISYVKSQKFDECHAKRLQEADFNLDIETEDACSIVDRKLLFRGHASSEYILKTTLERFADATIAMLDYCNYVDSVKNEFETFSGKEFASWNLQDWVRWEREHGGSVMHGGFPSFEFMVYLRHHGFPSPLLDWTASPFVAAYFAFREKIERAKYVSVYALWEAPAGVKMSILSEPHIITIGKNIRSHKRHFLQQSEYSMCVKIVNNVAYFASHEDALIRRSGLQDYIVRFDIPVEEREKALSYLDRYNINEYSLFLSEDSLATTLARKNSNLLGIAS